MQRRDVLKGLGALGGTAGIGSLGAGSILLAPSAQAEAEPGRWIRLETENFFTYGAFKEAKLREEAAALEAFHAVLTRLISDHPQRASKLQVYFADNDHDFDLAEPSMGDNVGGFYDASLEQTRAVVSVKMGRESQRDYGDKARAFDRRLILFHEYVHHFQLAVGKQTYPPWYIEGFAEMLGTAEFNADGCVLGKFAANRAIWLSSGNWLGIEKFLTKRPFELSETENAMFYAQAWLTTHMLTFNLERAQGFDRYVQALTNGGDFLAAFEPSFGITPKQFENEVKDYRNGKIQTRLMRGFTIKPDMPMTVTRLPRSADELLMPLTFLRSQPHGKQQQTLKQVRSQAARFPDDAFAGVTLAYAEIWLGDLSTARTVIDKLLAATPDDAEVHHLSGLCELRMGYAANDPARIAASVRSFVKAHQIDGSRASSLFRYAEAKSQGPSGLDTNVVDALTEAWRLKPQSEAICLLLAQGLIQQERFDEAILVLRPLSSSAHGHELSEVASKMIDVARAKARLPVLTYFGSARNDDKPDKD